MHGLFALFDEERAGIRLGAIKRANLELIEETASSVCPPCKCMVCRRHSSFVDGASVAPEARVSRNPRPGCPASSATGSARYLKPKANRRLCLTRLWARGFAHVPEHRISVAVAAIGQPRTAYQAK
jgi:hypothetical protein